MKSILNLFLSLTAFIVQSAKFEHKPNGGRIINGTLATVGATKHQVSVRRKLQDSYFFGTGHICGGSLIAPNVVLSAAHCFVDYNFDIGAFLPDTDFIVSMGNLDRFEQNDLTLVYEVKEIVYNNLTRFNLSTFDKDIALLFLNDSVPADHPTVQPILLNRNDTPAGTVCQVTGWGDTELGYASDVLLTVDVPIIDKNTCAYDTDYSPESIIDGMLCAGYLNVGERDACQGDSGGPFVCTRKLTGIVSWGNGCAEPLSPGVYTEVSFYAPWIESQLKTKNITLPDANDAGPPRFKSSLMLICVLYFILNIINVL